MNVTPIAFRRISTIAAASFGLLVVTGGAVRLTGSGLGCPDWPSCFSHQLVAADSFHSLVEFTNRMVTVVVTVVSVVTVLAALARTPRRSDLTWLSVGLLVGILGQIVLGGIVVLTKLNPYLVGLHFLLTLAILADALILRDRAMTAAARGSLLVSGTLVWLTRLLVATITVLLFAGTLVAGAGPHSGGIGTKRVAIAFSSIAQLHSDIALFLIGMMLATLFAFHQAGAPHFIQQHARITLEILTAQGLLGFTQYFLHDNRLVVEFHIAGATIAWTAIVLLYLSLRAHAPEFADARPMSAP